VVVEKEGFIAWAKDVQVERNQASTEVVTLIPSPDFIDAYRSRNRLYRVAAYVATGLAVGGLGFAGFREWGKDGVVDSHERFKPLQDGFASGAGDRASLAQACAAVGVDTSGAFERACHDAAQELADQGKSAQLEAGIGLGVGLAAAAAALYFWLAGDDPGRYDIYRTEPAPGAGKPAAGLFLTPGGAFTAAAWRF
jgi:hypothetical protein